MLTDGTTEIHAEAWGNEMDNNLALSAVELVPRSELNCNSQWCLIVSFWLGLLSFSELTDKVSQSATQLLYREMTLSKSGVACTLLPVQKDAI